MYSVDESPLSVKLPNSVQAQVAREKITGYLLSPKNPRSRSKADFFLRFGFRREQWEDLAEALRMHGASHEVTEVIDTAHGSRYHVEGTLETPDGRNPRVKTVWQVDIGSVRPRFITAHPIRG